MNRDISKTLANYWDEHLLPRIYPFFVRVLPNARDRRFVKLWQAALTEGADTFVGLYGSMARIADGKSKSPFITLGEWHDRTRYKWESAPVTRLGAYTIKVSVDSEDASGCVRWANLILDAAKAAGITWDLKGQIKLDEITATAYIEWEGGVLYIGDIVEVMNPAWYQGGKLLEQGHCTLVKPGESNNA